MKHDKLIAVMLVAIMTTTAVSAVALSATPAAALTTATKIDDWGSYNLITFLPQPAPGAGETFILYGQLLTWNNIALSGKNVEIWQRLPSQSVGTQLTTVKSLANGAFATTTSATQPTYYRALFRGDGANTMCMSPLYLVSAGAQRTDITLGAYDTSVLPVPPALPQPDPWASGGVPFYLAGQLTDSNGNGMANRHVNLWVRTNAADNTGGKILDSTTTDQFGFYQVLVPGVTLGTTDYFRAVYSGDTGFVPAYSMGGLNFNAIEVSNP